MVFHGNQLVKAYTPIRLDFDPEDIPQNVLKTFEEAKGLAISDYQTYLEKEWIKSLKQKYPVTINQPEVDKLVQKK